MSRNATPQGLTPPRAEPSAPSLATAAGFWPVWVVTGSRASHAVRCLWRPIIAGAPAVACSADGGAHPVPLGLGAMSALHD